MVKESSENAEQKKLFSFSLKLWIFLQQLVSEGKEPYPYATESVSEIIKQNNLYK